MKKQYYALKASLPMLLFDEMPPLSSAAFLGYCEAYLAPAKQTFLKALTLAPRSVPADSNAQVMRKYTAWEICLRNTLARLRAAKLSVDPEPYVVKFADYETTAASAAQSVFSMNADPLEKEKALDRARWDFLESMEWNHAFDFDALCIYRCKLLILEKWAARRKGNAAEILDEAAARSEQKTEKTE